MPSTKKKIVITSMYANPIHPGHIECLEKAKGLGDHLIVIVNNDEQQKLKTGSLYQDEKFRQKVVSALKPVDETFLAVDEDGSVCESIRSIVKEIKKVEFQGTYELIFAKGGDRNVWNIPELGVCDELGVRIVDGLGDKTHNSSDYRKKEY